MCPLLSAFYSLSKKLVLTVVVSALIGTHRDSLLSDHSNPIAQFSDTHHLAMSIRMNPWYCWFNFFVVENPSHALQLY